LGHKRRKRRNGVRRSPEVQSQPVLGYKKKRGLSPGLKMVLAILAVIIIIGGTAYWQLSSQEYSQTLSGIFYSSPTVTSEGTKVSVPYSFVDENKLVFLDLKLDSQAPELTYEGRAIPLFLYRGGEYLPLIIISTPSQKVISGIRVCEPCGSFGFHIVEGKYLDCDACHTKWDIETLIGVSGGCPNYPPPKLTSSVGENIEIDLRPLRIKVTS